MRELNKQWLAGFFDGEGCICLTKRKDKILHHQLRIYIGQVDVNILMLIKSIYGGKVRKGGRGVNLWEIGHRELQKKFLSEIEPYLILKKPQAQMALIYLSTLGKYHKYNKVTNEVFKIRENSFLGLKSEKRKHSSKNRIESLT